jgi:putative phosphoesterase
MAVLGNNDSGLVGQLPEQRVFTVDGYRIAMIHDSGARQGRERRMRRRFPTVDLVVFGHSHIPVDAEGLDGQRLFNPGSPTDKRRQPDHTFGRLRIEDGQLVDHRILVI